MLLAEAAACASSNDLWLEGVSLRTRPSLDLAAMRTRGDAVGLLVRNIEAGGGGPVVDGTQKYAAALLNRANSLRMALGDHHPVVQAAAGTLPPELLDRARALLLARLAEEG